jgi:Tol biopolymer transport system component
MSPTGSRVLVIPASGGDVRVIPTGRVEPMAADWTPAGRIVLIADSPGTPNQAFLVDADGRGLQPFRRDSIASATRDSSVLLFESQAGGTIFATDRRRATARQLTRGFWAEQPSISPDERRIVFEKRTDPNNMAKSEIVLMELDGSGQTTITSGTDPSWSPDGKTILYKAMDGDGVLWVSIVDVATRVARRLTKGVHPEWSPSGDRIVFMRDDTDGRGGVYVIPAAGGKSICLTCRLAVPGSRPSTTQ